MKAFALGLVLKQRQKATRKWPILAVALIQCTCTSSDNWFEKPFHFSQIASVPGHAETAWREDNPQSFIAPGVTSLKGSKVYFLFPVCFNVDSNDL